MFEHLSKKDRKEIERKHQTVNAGIEGEVESLLNVRYNARMSTGDNLQLFNWSGGKRLKGVRMGYRKQKVWGRPTKMRMGVLD